jgi:hypothetical protein
MPTYSADQIIGKSLIARKRVALYRASALNSGESFASVDPGDLVGVVYSYVGGRNGLPLFWQFLSSSGSSYYALHEEGAFDVESLQDQGVLTTQEQQQQQEEENQSPFDKVLGLFASGGKWILIGAAAYFAYDAYSKNKSRK